MKRSDAEGMSNDELEAEIRQCNGMIQSLADSWVKEYWQLDREDVVQEIILAFVGAGRSYKPGGGRAFSTFAMEKAQWAVTRYASGELGRGIKPPKDRLITVDMVDLHKVVTADGTQLHETLAAPPHEREPLVDETIWEQLRSALTERQYEAMELLYRDDLEIKEIAARMGIGTAPVTELIRLAGERIREFMPHLGKLLRARRAA